MDLHCGHKSRVMSRLSRYSMLCDKVFPGRIDAGSFGQQDEHAFDPMQFCGGQCWRQAQAVLFNGSSRHDPELYKILRNDTRVVTLLWQKFRALATISYCGWRTCNVRNRTLVSTSNALTPDLGRCSRGSSPHRRGLAYRACDYPPKHGTAAPTLWGLFFEDERLNRSARFDRLVPVTTVPP